MSESPNPSPEKPDTPKKAPLRVIPHPKITNKGVDPALLRFLDDPDWRRNNVIEQQFRRLDYRLDQCIAGHTPLFVVCGPPGIHKSGKIDKKLARYSEGERVKWEATPPQERPERRTMLIEETQKEVFRPMYFRISGRISHPQMHCRMYWASHRREIFFMDDIASLRDKRIQELLQMASDKAARRMVHYNYHQDNLPDDRVPTRYPMRGCIIAVTNFDRKTEADQIVNLFSEPVLDRATELHFSFERRPLLQYVVKSAFVRQKGGPSDQTIGLLRYVYAQPSQAAVDQEEDDGGLGFKGDVDDAWKKLMQVRDYFLVNYERALISFRTLQKITRDRFTCRDDEWIEYAEDHLKPRPPKDQRDMGGRPAAFIERPDTNKQA